MKKCINTVYYKSPYGELLLGSYGNQLCLTDWRYRKRRAAIDARIKKSLKAEYVEEGSPILEETVNQLKQYFSRERTTFDLPLLLVGTDFQKTVWNALLEIPYGESQTYLGLSQKLDNIKAIRAVASANGANAISIIVPCHRIIGSDGSLVGYAGGLNAKRKLLDLENVMVHNQMTLFV